MPLRALARVNLAAIERNVARLQAGLTGGAELAAVVKGNGYGHGPAAGGAGGARRWGAARSPSRPPARRPSFAPAGSTRRCS